MKAYFLTTGIIFGLIAVGHVFQTVDHWERHSAEPSYYVTGPGLGLLAAALSIWAFRLLIRVRHK